MFDFFKKKDKGFKLDEFELPKLDDTKQENELPSLNQDLKSDIQNPFANSSNQDNDFGQNSLDSLNTSSNSLGLNKIDSDSNSSFSSSNFDNLSLNNNINNNNNNFQSNNFSSNNTENSSFQNQNDSGNLDLVKTKIEMIESKMSLTDARIANIEQKVNLIYRLILEEVSDETKRKFNVDKMMNNIRQN